MANNVAELTRQFTSLTHFELSTFRESLILLEQNTQLDPDKLERLHEMRMACSLAKNAPIAIQESSDLKNTIKKLSSIFPTFLRALKEGKDFKKVLNDAVHAGQITQKQADQCEENKEFLLRVLSENPTLHEIESVELEESVQDHVAQVHLKRLDLYYSLWKKAKDKTEAEKGRPLTVNEKDAIGKQSEQRANKKIARHADEGLRLCGNPHCTVVKIERWKKCGRCLSTNYCGKECQTSDWKRHKVTCVNHEAGAGAGAGAS